MENGTINVNLIEIINQLEYNYNVRSYNNEWQQNLIWFFKFCFKSIQLHKLINNTIDFKNEYNDII